MKDLQLTYTTFRMVWVATSYSTFYAFMILSPKMDLDAQMVLVMNTINEGFHFVNDVHELRD